MYDYESNNLSEFDDEYVIVNHEELMFYMIKHIFYKNPSTSFIFFFTNSSYVSHLR